MLSKILSIIMSAWIGITIVWIGSEVNTVKGSLMVATCFFSGMFAYWLLDYLTESED
jgi:hypothetical protein